MGHDQIIDKLALCTVKDLDQVQLSERSLCALAITCNLDVEKPRCLEVCVGYPELLADVSKRRGLHEILIESNRIESYACLVEEMRIKGMRPVNNGVSDWLISTLCRPSSTQNAFETSDRIHGLC